jgi:hypothetical protein
MSKMRGTLSDYRTPDRSDVTPLAEPRRDKKRIEFCRLASVRRAGYAKRPVISIWSGDIMPELVKELDARLKGSLQETEDWWRLMRGEDGILFVEHKWSHTKLSTLKTDFGSERIEVDDFLAKERQWADRARAALQEYLGSAS